MTIEVPVATSGSGRRAFLRQLAALAAGAGMTTTASAQAYPARHITMTLPTGPGSPSDLIGRKLATVMAQIANVSVVPDNTPGANGIIGVQTVMNAPADGYNVMFTTTST